MRWIDCEVAIDLTRVDVLNGNLEAIEGSGLWELDVLHEADGQVLEHDAIGCREECEDVLYLGKNDQSKRWVKDGATARTLMKCLSSSESFSQCFWSSPRSTSSAARERGDPS